jgi:hypothetical protein
LTPLVCDPRSQLGDFGIALRNIAVSVYFAIVGKFTKMVLPRTGGAAAAHLKPRLSNASIRKRVIDDVVSGATCIDTFGV